jgi:hypothetical protein
MENGKIDIVVPWVDGSDIAWQNERNRYLKRKSDDVEIASNIRYESWELKYWFRAIEKFTPWFNNIIFITCGHLPDFIDASNPRLKIVKHSDYIPAKYLPTFNSNTIEMNMYHIDELSENFVYFNDDLFPLQPIDESYYFKNDRVCDEAVESHFIIDSNKNFAYNHVNMLIMINKYFDKREVQKKNYDKWYCSDYGELLERTKGLSYFYDFCGFRDPHMANPFKKSTFRRLWELEGDELDKASMNRFRSYNDYTPYLARYWQLCEGNFNPRRTLGKPLKVNMGNVAEIADIIRNSRYQMVSLNEYCTEEEFIYIRKIIGEAFEEILPERSSFEKKTGF